MYAAVVLDLDGTFLQSDKQVSDRNRKSVLACYEQGMRIIFATARPPRAVKWFLPKDLLNIGSFIYYNGAMISCIHSGISLHQPITSALTAEILDHCIGSDPGIEIGIEVLDEWFSLKEVDSTIVMNVKGNPVVKSIDELRRFDATKILITGNVDHDLLNERFSSDLNILLTDNGQLTQIMSKKASKEQAVLNLMDEFGMDMKNVVVFGDDYNDVGLFRTCGWSVAMGNAVPILKSIASEITDNNDNDGVAIVLDRIMNTKYIRSEEKKYHDSCYESNKLFEPGSWLHKPVKTVLDCLEELNDRSFLNVLDLGCGVGRNSIPIAETLKSRDGRVVCVDLLDSAIEKLQDYSKEYGVYQFIESIISDIEHFHIGRAEYDLIISVSALEHVSSVAVLERKLIEMAMGTKANGINCIIINSNVREIQDGTNMELEPLLEVNMTTESLLKLLDRQYEGWEIKVCKVKPLEFLIERNGNPVKLLTNCITFVSKNIQ